MKKGTSPATAMTLIFEGLELGLTENKLKTYVINGYNQIYSVQSRDTVIANLREDAIKEHQEEMFIEKLPQDNNKVDFIAVKIENDLVRIVISQQKGNNASFNSTSLSKTLEKLSELVIQKKYIQYFNLLPDKYNPLINNMKYDVNVIVGFTLACGSTNHIYNGVKIPFLCGQEYLNEMGIYSKSMIDLDYWVLKQEKIKKHEYNAINKCCDFDVIYAECLSKITN
jgi:hypothetical protein